MSSSSSSPVVAVPVSDPKVSIKLRPSKERGHANHGWLNSYHTFSFAGYYDEEFPGYHSLRVINEDRVSGGNGFPTHPHREYEIFSYIVNGSLKHNDSLGNQEILSRGDVQFTSAGRGIAHSEYNASNKDLVHFIQIWVKPNISQLTPSYQTASFNDSQKLGKLCLIVGRDQDKKEQGNQGIITIHQDFKMYASLLRDNESVSYTLEPGRALYVHVIQDVAGFAKEGNACGLGVKHSHSHSHSPFSLGSGDGAFIEFQSNGEAEAAAVLTFLGKQLNKKAGSTSEAPTEFILFDVKKENEKYR